MEVMQDIRTEYDLGDNPMTVYYYDNAGKAYRETRTYARGYRITDASFSETGEGEEGPSPVRLPVRCNYGSDRPRRTR